MGRILSRWAPWVVCSVVLTIIETAGDSATAVVVVVSIGILVATVAVLEAPIAKRK